MFDRTIITMKLRFSPFDPQSIGLVDALYHFNHFMIKISKLACLFSYDKDAKFSANFTEILTSNLGSEQNLAGTGPVKNIYLGAKKVFAP